MRAQNLWETPPTISITENEGKMGEILDAEVEHSAMVIATAFLNPGKLN